MIIPAIGQRANLACIEGTGINTTRWGTIEADPVTYMTSREGVFAAGDVHVGPWIAIGAVAGGKEAAESIDRYLQGKDMAAGRGISEEAKAMQNWVDIPLDEEKKVREHMPQLEPELCCVCFDEVKQGYTESRPNGRPSAASIAPSVPNACSVSRPARPGPLPINSKKRPWNCRWAQ